MKTRNAIYIEFQQTEKQAKALLECAADMERINKRINSVMDTLNSQWKGNGATLYLRKCEALKTKISRTSKNLRQIANVVQTSAKAYRDAELKALQAIQSKK